MFQDLEKPCSPVSVELFKERGESKNNQTNK